MCKPDYYSINYSINPWMNVENSSNKNLAQTQWKNLNLILRQLGVDVLEMEGQPNLPDLVFTANAGLIFPEKKVVLSNFKFKERQPEKDFYKNWFEENGYEVITVFSDSLFFEGAGDALFNESKSKLYFGYGFRSEIDAITDYSWIKVWEKQICYLKLIDPYFYHLDTCFCPLRDNYALIWSEAFEEQTLRMLSQDFKLLYVEKEDAYKFACNAVSVEEKVIIPSGCNHAKNLLKNAGFDAIETDMSEYIKAGGAVRCATMNI